MSPKNTNVLTSSLEGNFFREIAQHICVMQITPCFQLFRNLMLANSSGGTFSLLVFTK